MNLKVNDYIQFENHNYILKGIITRIFLDIITPEDSTEFIHYTVATEKGPVTIVENQIIKKLKRLTWKNDIEYLRVNAL